MVTKQMADRILGSKTKNGLNLTGVTSKMVANMPKSMHEHMESKHQEHEEHECGEGKSKKGFGFKWK